MDLDRYRENGRGDDAWKLAVSGSSSRFAPANRDDLPSLNMSPAWNGSDHEESDEHSREQRGGFDLPALIRSIGRHLAWSLPVGALLGLAVAPLAWKLSPGPTYTASALFRVSASNATLLGPNPNVNRDEFKRYQQTQETLIKSDKVISSALSKTSIAATKTIRQAEEPLDLVKDATEIVFDGEILRISMTLPDEGDVLKLVNAIADVYKDQVVGDEERQREERIRTLKEVQEKTLEDLKQLHQKYREQTENLGTNDPSHRTAVIQQSFANAKEKLDSIDFRRKEAKIEADVLGPQAGVSSRPNSTPTPTPPDDEAINRATATIPVVSETQIQIAIRGDQRIVQLKSQLSQLQNRKTNVERTARNPDSDPAHKQIVAQIQQIRQDLSDREREIRLAAKAEAEMAFTSSKSTPTKSGRPAPEPFQEPKNIAEASIDKRIAYYEKLQAELERDLAKLSEDLRKLGTSTVDMETLQFKLRSKEDTFKQLSAQLGSLAIEVQAPHRIELFEMANRAIPNGSRKRLMAAGAAGVGCLASMVLLAGWVEFRIRRVLTRQDVTQGLGLKLLGMLPDHGMLVGNQSTRARWHSRTLESIDSIRASLLHQARLKGFNTILVSSACENEAKTTLACQLALSLSRSGRRALLIDANLRHPSAHSKFGLDNGLGLSEVLRGEVSVGVAIREIEGAMASGIGALKFLSAGSIDAQALLALGQERFGILIRDLKRGFDFVIIDSAPVLPVADALLISDHVDTVLLSLLRNESRVPLAARAIEKFQTLGVNIVGAVLSGAREKSFSRDYEANYTTPLAIDPAMNAEGKLLTGVSIETSISSMSEPPSLGQASADAPLVQIPSSARSPVVMIS